MNLNVDHSFLAKTEFTYSYYSCGELISITHKQVNYENEGLIYNGNRMEWSPIQSAIIQVIEKIG